MSYSRNSTAEPALTPADVPDTGQPSIQAVVAQDAGLHLIVTVIRVAAVPTAAVAPGTVVARVVADVVVVTNLPAGLHAHRVNMLF